MKKAHLSVLPGLKEYVEFFVDDQMIGQDSPLAEYGLVAAPDAEREEVSKPARRSGENRFPGAAFAASGSDRGCRPCRKMPHEQLESKQSRSRRRQIAPEWVG